jgi:hypothetical protein
MKRWIWIIVMAPVMWGLWRLVVWADRLHAWQYSAQYAPPTEIDYARAAIVFWGALATPLLVGFAACVVAFRREYQERWPTVELILFALPWFVLYGSLLPIAKSLGGAVGYLEEALLIGNILIGGTIVVTLQNIGACLRHRKWGKFTLSTLACCVGFLYLFWLYAFIIYLDT